MITEKQKLDNFHEAIDHYALEQRQSIENEIKQLKEERLRQAENEVLTEAFRLIQKEMAEMRHRISREMALREIDTRRKLLIRRSEIMSEVFDRAKKRLHAFTETEAYGAFLERRAGELSSTLTEPGTVLHLRGADRHYFERLAAAIGQPCELLEDNTIELGGFYAENAAMGLFADVTLDAMLADQVPWFEENAGLTVI